MKYIRTNILLKSDNPIRLNEWTGSTIRGAICNKLLRNDCVRKDHNCKECNMRDICANAILFQGKASGQPANPIVINTNYYGVKDLCSNIVEFELVLVGHAVLVYKNILDILQEGIDICYKKFKLLKYDEDVQIEELKNIELSNHIKIVFESGVNLEWLALKEDLTFRNFIRAVLIRTKVMYTSLGIESNYSYQDLLEKAEKIELVSQKKEIVTLNRKNKQKDKLVSLKCINGTFEYKGDMSEFIPYISLCSLINIGKWCTMGLGRFKVINVR